MPKPKEWKIKTTEEGTPVIDGTKVVFVDPDGKELPLDPPQMYNKIIELGNENKGHREKKNELSESLKIFEGIDDLAEYRQKADKALETVTNFNDKDWMKAEKVEQLKKEMSDSYEQKITQKKQAFEQAIGEKDQVISKKDQQIHKLLISNNFAIHPLFGGPKPKTKLSPELAEAYFSKHFRLEEQEGTHELVLKAYHDPGRFEQPVYSRENPGEDASFLEAMDELWEKYPGKDALTNASGSGSGNRQPGDEGEFDTDDLASMRKAHAKALADGDVKTAIALKNKMHAARQNAA